MCGIFGISYGPGGPAAEGISPTALATKLFPAIAHRGRDATGLMWCDGEGTEGIEWAKWTGPADDPEVLKDVHLPISTTWLVGHVRAATRGSPTFPINNHPVRHGDYIGVHNGFIRNYAAILDETGRADRTCQVDSEAIFAAIHKWGIKPGLSRLEGSMVAVFADVRKPTALKIARGVDRPLVYCTTKAGSLVFASEVGVLHDSGLDLNDDVVDLTGRRYKVITIKAGRITSREQYRADLPTTHYTTSTSGTSLSGITDHFSGGTPRRLGAGKHDQRPGSGAPALRKPDKWGGVHLGGGRYRTPDGRLMNIEEYVEWCVGQAMAKVKSEAAGDSVEAAKAIIENNGAQSA